MVNLMDDEDVRQIAYEPVALRTILLGRGRGRDLCLQWEKKIFCV